MYAPECPWSVQTGRGHFIIRRKDLSGPDLKRFNINDDLPAAQRNELRHAKSGYRKDGAGQGGENQPDTARRDQSGICPGLNAQKGTHQDRLHLLHRG